MILLWPRRATAVGAYKW